MATAYEKVQLARGKGRPSGLSFIQNIFPDFIELHGDRRFADDPAVIGGIGSLGGVFVGAVVLTLLSNFAQNLTERYMTLTGLVFILILLFAPAGLAGIGAQVKRFIERRRTPAPDADGPPQDPPAAQPAERAITEGTQQ